MYAHVIAVGSCIVFSILWFWFSHRTLKRLEKLSTYKWYLTPEIIMNDTTKPKEQGQNNHQVSLIMGKEMEQLTWIFKLLLKVCGICMKKKAKYFEQSNHLSYPKNSTSSFTCLLTSHSRLHTQRQYRFHSDNSKSRDNKIAWAWNTPQKSL